MKRLLMAGAALAIALSMTASASAADKKTLAFVVNGASDFWKIAEAGVKKAQEELPNYNLELKYPEQAAAAIQQRLMDDRVASQVPLFTTDSDAPQSKRIAYIGSSNVELGKNAGQLMLKALPEGGKCM